MVNYQNGKIYKIESIIGNCRYIGSTCKKHLCSRLSAHKYDFKQNKCGITSGLVLKYPDAKIILLEAYPCNSKDELVAKEAEYIRQLDCVNKRIEGRTKKQHYQDNREIILKKCKQYQLENKEKRSEYDKKYREKNRVKIIKKQKQWRENNTEKIKIKKKVSYEKNKEKILKKQREYQLKNKEKIRKRQNTVINCECGNNYTKSNKARHVKSKRHLKFIEQQ